ncbi:MAG: aspartate aminotransferase family protein [Ilumatobacteraceae bacterium]
MSAHSFDTEGLDHCPFMPVFGAPSVMFERGSGTELWDVNGKRYLDFLSGIAVVSLGHCNAAVNAAVTAQLNTLAHVSNFFANPAATRAATDLDELLHEASGHWGQIFLCNSGAEANEAAIKLARKFGGRGRHVVVSALGSFHGRTLAALAATGQPAKHEPFQPMPEGFRHVAFGDLAALEASLDPSVAAVLIETVQGEGGVIPAPPEYLQGIRRLCDERGMLMMVDEVQTGFARTGEWFGFQHAGVAPDVVTMAKGIGNGFPVGAIWARREVAAVFQPGDHGSTYSGTAIAGAAVSAVIAEMKRIDAPRMAREKGEHLARRLSAVEGVVDVRGQGLLRAADLGSGRDAKAVYGALLERGLVTNAVNATSLRLAPPITTPVEQIDEAVSIIASVLAEGVGA